MPPDPALEHSNPLSPVPESASSHTPRPSLISRHAAPKTPALLPASTIVGKRIGARAEDSMKRGLWITDSNGRTGREKGRFPVRASRQGESKSGVGEKEGNKEADKEVEREAPWTPSLTPRRTPRGELVIEVGE